MLSLLVATTVLMLFMPKSPKFSPKFQLVSASLSTHYTSIHISSHSSCPCGRRWDKGLTIEGFCVAAGIPSTKKVVEIIDGLKQVGTNMLHSSLVQWINITTMNPTSPLFSSGLVDLPLTHPLPLHSTSPCPAILQQVHNTLPPRDLSLQCHPIIAHNPHPSPWHLPATHQPVHLSVLHPHTICFCFFLMLYHVLNTPHVTDSLSKSCFNLDCYFLTNSILSPHSLL